MLVAMKNMADISDMNLPSFASSWFSLSF